MINKAACAARHSLTRRYKVRHSKRGRLFGDRYKAVVLEGEDRYHYQTLMDYIHLNPVRTRMIRPKAGQSVMDYAWSSVAGGYALPSKKRAKWLDAAAGLKAFNLADTVAGRREMVERLDKRAVSEEIKSSSVPPQTEEVDQRASHLRRGWYWDTQGFGKAMRKLGRYCSKRPRLFRGPIKSMSWCGSTGSGWRRSGWRRNS